LPEAHFFDKLLIVPVFNLLRQSFYQDSVTLMRLTRDLESLPGVERASAMMGTPHNRELLREAGLLTAEGERAAATDLIIAVIADERQNAERAQAAAEAALTTRRETEASTSGWRPRTLEGALRALPGANLALVSVPGEYAGAEAHRALDAGLHVMLFSDNVPLDTEIQLKRFAVERDLFLMGPDCGTAIVDGVPLGFANAVPRGRIGIAAASGTGLQEVSVLVALAGEGVSQAIGLGGRDLTDQVGGLMAERALDALARDSDTTIVCLIGKPPGARVATRLEERVAALGKPCVVHFAGERASGAFEHAAATLEETADLAVALARGVPHTRRAFSVSGADVTRMVDDAVRSMAAGQRFVRGVYAGGTLAYEAITLLSARLAGVAAEPTGGGTGHRVVDLGDDRFTVGRPHPMIDGTLRREWIETEGRDPETAVLLLDVVLGYGAHPDPAGELVPAIERAVSSARATGRSLAVVASVCGTDRDPQSRAAQVAALRRSGVAVMPSNAQAARLAALIGERRAGR